MSVIDKMLRDLDRRQSAGTAKKAGQEAESRLARGTLLVDAIGPDPDAVAKASPPWRTIFVGLVLLLLLGLGGWWLKKSDLHTVWPGTAGLQPVPALPPSTQQPSLVAAQAAVVDTAAPPVPGKADAVAAKLQLEGAKSSKKSGQAVTEPAVGRRERPDRTAPISLALPTDMSMKMDSVLKESPGVGAPPPLPGPSGTPSSSAAPTASPAASAAVRPASAMEALAHAQRLWNAGSRLPAIDLLSEALALLERTPMGSASVGTGAVAPLAAVARELARMELAEGQVTQALEMLTRLQPSLGNVADIWAMRGNAAQRLGRHEESVTAYRAALRLRPDEARWMVGAAISLAAQGQIAAATELAEKARSGGALTHEIATYLQQLGVTLVER